MKGIIVFDNWESVYYLQISEEIKEVLNQTRKTDNKNRPISNSHHLSAQTVFSVLDYLVKWKRFQAQKAPVNPGKGIQTVHLIHSASTC